MRVRIRELYPERFGGDLITDELLYEIEEVRKHGFKIDGLKWLKDEGLEDGGDLPEPEELLTSAIEELEGATDELRGVLTILNK